MSTDVANALRQARARIEKPEHFCKSVSARDAYGVAVDAKSPQACQWCVYGAIDCDLTVPDIDVLWDRTNRALHAALTAGSHPSIVNDIEGHAAVLAMLDRAIAAEDAST